MKGELVCTAVSKIEIADNGIRDEGIAAICEYLKQQGLPHPNRHDLDFEWVWLNRRGTLPKRLAGWMQRQHSRKLNQAQLSQVGNLAAQNCDRQKHYNIDLTNKFDWSAGDFGDSGSCFWSDRSAARVMLEEDGAFALRFFKDDGGGVGRCWVVQRQIPNSTGEREQVFILFNGYHSEGLTLISMARVFATWRGLSYRRIGLTNNGKTTGKLYINSGTGFICGEVNTISSVDTFDLEIEEVETMSCHNCSCVVNDDDYYTGPDGLFVYCPDCFHEEFFCCEDCGEITPHNDGCTTFEGAVICASCQQDHYSCASCGTAIRRNSNVHRLVERDGRESGETYCPDCIDEAQDRYNEQNPAPAEEASNES